MAASRTSKIGFTRALSAAVEFPALDVANAWARALRALSPPYEFCERGPIKSSFFAWRLHAICLKDHGMGMLFVSPISG
jgi:hypothetical protein